MVEACRYIASVTLPAGWHPDPEGRFEYRYYNGTAWTGDVAVGGRRYVDLPATQPHDARSASPPPAAPGSHGPNALDAPQAGPPVWSGTPRTSRRSTWAMIVGIVAASMAWLPVLFVVGIAGGIVAIALGAPRCGRRQPSPGRGFARAGVVTGSAALALSAVGLWFTTEVFQAVDDYENPAAHEAEITRCDADGESGDGQATIEGIIRNTETGTSSASYTVRIEINRADSGRTIQRASVEVSGVAPGERQEFRAQRNVNTTDIDCTIVRVDGPLPYGFDPE